MREARVVIRLELAGIPQYVATMRALAFGLEVRTIMLGWAPRQLEAHAHPGQPTHHSAPPIKPCTCAYHVATTPHDGYLVVPSPPKPDTVDGLSFEVWYPRSPVLSWFTIRRSCPHHGWQ